MTSPPRASCRKKAYHHGNLRLALLDAAEALLREEGPQGLKLRAITRLAGVSHTAANPHFGDLTGLISELATIGFERLRTALLNADTLGRGYVNFALDQPHLFTLMFRSNLPNFDHPALRQAADNTARELRQVSAPNNDGERALTLAEGTRMAAGWSLVHGLSSLIIDGQLDTIVERIDPTPDLAAMIDAVLDTFSAGRTTPTD